MWQAGQRSQAPAVQHVSDQGCQTQLNMETNIQNLIQVQANFCQNVLNKSSIRNYSSRNTNNLFQIMFYVTF